MKTILSSSTTHAAMNSQQTEWIIPHEDVDRASPAGAHHASSRRWQEIRQTKEGKEKRRMSARQAGHQRRVTDLANGGKKKEEEIQ